MNDLSKIVIEQEEIVDFLKTEIELKEIYQKILFQKVIDRTAYERGIIVTAEEIEAEADRQRRQKRLERATDTLAWLADQLVSPQDWEAGIRNHLLAQKLAETLFAKEVEQFFIQNRLEFEQVILYQMTVYEEKLAQELYYQIEEGEISFYDAAHLYDRDVQRRYQCGYEGKMYRFALQPNIAAVLFSTPPKQLIGPVKTELGYHLFIVEELIPAELTAQRYQEILNNMFQQWLAVELEFILQLS
ncbi:MAG: peptidylprolyl isomerase [Cyanomargarita calcarea GSE-NOS-MK-12-04C]|jgi:parvulin-like peptidyl-prolyl isomerase|uniref:Peptidylprolyl isomerase n=1 Tax=Cyanomargarita calcarea GSE-NOS-MK-12-04C TaxID=2839659 RepID=A0A951UR54_9CYAN|nr:peptidylprolyl isomerase [Cyanomargarita calcarea GSE-NOS-MK-12-04C]